MPEVTADGSMVLSAQVSWQEQQQQQQCQQSTKQGSLMVVRAGQLAQQFTSQLPITFMRSAVACQQVGVTCCSALQAGLGKETQLLQWPAYQAGGTRQHMTAVKSGC
jgi:hypothetical protein